MKISMDTVLNNWQEWLTSVDSDTLAEMTGKLFGGECTFIHNSSDIYFENQEFEFIPNDHYMGAFGK